MHEESAQPAGLGFVSKPFCLAVGRLRDALDLSGSNPWGPDSTGDPEDTHWAPWSARRPALTLPTPDFPGERSLPALWSNHHAKRKLLLSLTLILPVGVTMPFSVWMPVDMGVGYCVTPLCWLI